MMSSDKWVPTYATVYWSFDKYSDMEVCEHMWVASGHDKRRLEAGRVFRTREAAEAACDYFHGRTTVPPEAPAVESAPAPDGWIPWFGGGCPVPEGTRVDVRHRDGYEFCGSVAGQSVSSRKWRCDGERNDIVAYRVCKPEAPVGEPEQKAEGRKDDRGKAPWGLLPFDAVGQIVEVLRFGAQKYSPRNWEAGMDWNRPFDACLRHLTAWWGGEDKDPETGLSHLAHAGCCILFLLAYSRRGVGKDNRPKKMY